VYGSNALLSASPHVSHTIAGTPLYKWASKYLVRHESRVHSFLPRATSFLPMLQKPMEGCDACSPKALRKAYIAVGKAVLASEDYVDDLPVAFMHLTGV